jgi:hypothetical protein
MTSLPAITLRMGPPRPFGQFAAVVAQTDSRQFVVKMQVPGVRLLWEPKSFEASSTVVTLDLTVNQKLSALLLSVEAVLRQQLAVALGKSEEEVGRRWQSNFHASEQYDDSWRVKCDLAKAVFYDAENQLIGQPERLRGCEVHLQLLVRAVHLRKDSFRAVIYATHVKVLRAPAEQVSDACPFDDEPVKASVPAMFTARKRMSE